MQKSWKKALSIFLAFVMIISVINPAVFAADITSKIKIEASETSSYGIEMSFDKTTVKPGSTITLTVKKNDATAIYGAQIVLKPSDGKFSEYFDSVTYEQSDIMKALEYTTENISNSYTVGNAVDGKAVAFPKTTSESYKTKNGDPAFSSVTSTKKTGTLFVIHLKLKADVTAEQVALAFGVSDINLTVYTGSSGTSTWKFKGDKIFATEGYNLSFNVGAEDVLAEEENGESGGQQETVATPTFDTTPGAVTSGTEVSISCDTNDATIYYTTGTSDYSSGDWQKYDANSKPTITRVTTIKAVAVKEGYTNSEVATADYTVEQEEPSYQVNVSSGITNGSVTVSSSTAEAGTHITVTATANNDYVLSSLSATTQNGIVALQKNSDGTFTFTMPEADVSLTAEFVAAVQETQAPGYTVTNNNGIYTVKNSDDVLVGTYEVATESVVTIEDGAAVGSQLVTVTVTPEDGYGVAGVYYQDGGERKKAELGTSKSRTADVQTWTFTAKQNTTVSVEFGQIHTGTYTRVDTSGNALTTGSATYYVNGEQTKKFSSNAPAGALVNIELTATGYTLQSLTLTWGENESLDITQTLSYIMPDADVQIKAVFCPINYNLIGKTEPADAEGVLSFTVDNVPNQTTAQKGQTVKATATCKAGWYLALVKREGAKDPEEGSEYAAANFTMASSDVTLVGTFEWAGTVNVTAEAEHATVYIGSTQAEAESKAITGSTTMTKGKSQLYVYVVPEEGYALDSISYLDDKGTMQTIDNPTYSQYVKSYFTYDMQVKVVCKKIDTSVTSISSVADLIAFRDSVNNGNDYLDKTVTLNTDLTVTDAWVPIGSASKQFYGTFDGGGHTITYNLDDTTEGCTEYIGLFGYLGSGATIKNLNVAGSINVSQVGYYVGGIAGWGDAANFYNCSSDVTINATCRVSVGGIVGRLSGNNDAILEDCLNYGNITLEGTLDYVGGIVGSGSFQRMTRCANYGDIYHTGPWTQKTDSKGGVTKEGYEQTGYAGGLIGSLSGWASCTISESCNRGNISGHMWYGGGLIGTYFGHNSGAVLTIENSYNIGMVQNRGCYLKGNIICLAGLVGQELEYKGEKLVLTNCFSTATTTSSTTGAPLVWRDLVCADETPTKTNCYIPSQISEMTAAQLATALGSAFKENNGSVQLSWETIGTTAVATYAATFTATPENATVQLFTDMARSNVVTGWSNGGSLAAGTYYYRVSASGYLTQEGSITISHREVNLAVTLEKVASVTFTVTPTDASLSVEGSDEDVLNLVSSEDGTYTYLLSPGSTYTYSVSKDGYTGVSEQLTVPESGTSVTVTLEKITVADDSKVNGDSTITKGGTYYVQSGATGTITIDTKEAVTLVGSGISTTGMYSDLTIDCAAGTKLTIQNMYIQNNVGLGTSSGSTNTGNHIINFTGSGNTLNFEGINLLENQEYVQAAGIHVGKGSSLTIGGSSSGTLYMYKYSQGAGIGGDAGEACGTITFAGGDIFIKGSKTGALIGGDATDGTVNGTITIIGGNLNLVNKAMGAAIGASSKGTCAGTVRITGGNVTITSDYSGSAIGHGGGTSGSGGTLYVTGGSLKCIVTANSSTGTGGSSSQTVSDALITADMGNLKLLTYNAAGKTVTVKATDSNSTYTATGGHYYYYTESSTSTMANWSYQRDTNVYMYLDSTKTYTLTCGDKTYNVAWSSTDKAFTLTDPNSDATETPDDSNVTETPVDTDTTVKDGNANITVDDDALIDAADKADKNTQIVISADTKDKKVTTVTASISKDALTAVVGSGAAVKVDSEIATVVIPNEALESISKTSGETVTITTEISKDKTTTIDIAVDGKTVATVSGGIQATIPADSGLVAVLVSEDGTETVIKKSIVEDGTASVLLDGSATIKISDKSTDFDDVGEAWYTDAVNFASSHGLFEGVGDNRFAPGSDMTRAMLATVLYRLEDSPELVSGNIFEDVKSDTWYEAAVTWCADNGIVEGYGDGKFGTNNSVTRQEMVTMLYRYVNTFAGGKGTTSDLDAFTDASKTASWAQEAMEWAVGSGIIEGKENGILDPTGTATRAEVATMLQRLIRLLVQ